MGAEIGALIDEHYPLARTCHHLSKKESLEQELDDDRLNWIVVERCMTCNFPMGDRDATAQDIERLRYETAAR